MFINAPNRAGSPAKESDYYDRLNNDLISQTQNSDQVDPVCNQALPLLYSTITIMIQHHYHNDTAHQKVAPMSATRNTNIVRLTHCRMQS